jgi:exosortase A-associated hydrolase 2
VIIAAVRTPAEPIFLKGGAGRFFAIYHQAVAGVPPGGTVLLVPPFAEEMNKSRRMLAMMARRMSAMGYGALLLDLFGTGESEGDFVDARWSIWKEDIGCAVRWLAQRAPGPIHFLALRSGALLATDFAEQSASALGRLVLWQPVVNGELFLTQFLRLRLAASMMDSQRERESTQQLRRRFDSGEAVEVAGYTLAPELAQALVAQDLGARVVRAVDQISWMEVVTSAERSLSPVSMRVIEHWRTAGVPVETSIVIGEPFWSSPEITLAPALLDATVAAFVREATDAV